MTRELKLSLILGFSLVLIVTVLISDYLSKARTSRLDGTPPAAPVAAMPPSREELLSKQQAEEERLALAESREATRTRFDPTGGAAPTSPKGFQKNTDSGKSEPRKADNSEFKPEQINQGTRQPSRVADGSTPPKAGSTEQIPGAAPERTHTIAEGDSFYQLAQKYYKDRSLSKQLALYNGIKPEALKVGATIKIPSVEVLTGKVAKSSPLPSSRNAMGPDSQDRELIQVASNEGVQIEPLMKPDGLKPEGADQGKKQSPSAVDPKKADPKADPKASTKGGARTYTVKKGDTPGHIAARELGSSKRASEIIDLNSGLISDEYGLKVGMVIKLPAK